MHRLSSGGGSDNSRIPSGGAGGGAHKAQLTENSNTTITVSVSGNSSSGRGSLSRRSSREPSPSSIVSSFNHDANEITTSGNNDSLATCSGQDWRRLVGSIKRKVRRKVPANNLENMSSCNQDANKNHDDFLKATMRIFLVVSPPMARVQVR